MRLNAIEITGFRGFPDTYEFDLDANTIIIDAPNGQGKTSLFDAILWGLTGRVSRVGPDDELLSTYSVSGQMRTSVVLTGEKGTTHRITRSFDGAQQQVLIASDSQTFRGDKARSRIAELLWPEGDSEETSSIGLEAIMTSSLYLQQDLIREFVASEDVDERFDAVSQLVGIGRISEFQKSLERARAAWTRQTNVKQTELDSLRARIDDLRSQLSTLSSQPDLERELQDWAPWWQAASKLGVTIATPPVTAAEANSGLDAALRQLDALAFETSRRSSKITAIENAIKSNAPESQMQLDLLVAERQLTENLVENAHARLANATAEAEKSSAKLLLASDKESRRRALAELALQFLGKRCPVCDQAYDAEATQARLQSLLAPTLKVRGETKHPTIPEMAKELKELQNERARLEARIAAETERKLSLEQLSVTLKEVLQELGIGNYESLLKSVPVAKAANDALNEHIKRAQENGKRMALALALVAQSNRARAASAEIDGLTQNLMLLESTIARRNRAASVAITVLENIREVGVGAVKRQLEILDPLLQRIYATVDSHPAFRRIQFDISVKRKHGQLFTALFDDARQRQSNKPKAVLSSSQMNVLAVAVFFALNLGAPHLPIDCAILDDPLQSLDEPNLLGLVDLLRRAKEYRQLLVSTYDEAFGMLLSRKLRPVSFAERTTVIRIRNWTSRGPQWSQHDIMAETKSLKTSA